MYKFGLNTNIHRKNNSLQTKKNAYLVF